MTASNPPAESLRANSIACGLDASGISRMEGATVALPPLLSISLAISCARRLSSDSTRRPAKPPLEVSFPTIPIMQQSERFFQPWTVGHLLYREEPQVSASIQLAPFIRGKSIGPSDRSGNPLRSAENYMYGCTRKPVIRQLIRNKSITLCMNRSNVSPTERSRGSSSATGPVSNWNPTPDNRNDSASRCAYVDLVGRKALLNRKRRDTWFSCP